MVLSPINHPINWFDWNHDFAGNSYLWFPISSDTIWSSNKNLRLNSFSYILITRIAISREYDSSLHSYGWFFENKTNLPYILVYFGRFLIEPNSTQWKAYWADLEIVWNVIHARVIRSVFWNSVLKMDKNGHAIMRSDHMLDLTMLKRFNFS